MATPRDILLARRAIKHGKRDRIQVAWALRIILEARRAGIPISLGFAIVQQESNFKNVFGHDPTIYVGAGLVTKEKYLDYKRQRGKTRMQGVGPCQLTWWEFQDGADRLGGCWIPRYNIQRAFTDLAALIKQHGAAVGIARYNGSGLAAKRYSREVREKQAAWHRRLS